MRFATRIGSSAAFVQVIWGILLRYKSVFNRLDSACTVTSDDYSAVSLASVLIPGMRMISDVAVVVVWKVLVIQFFSSMATSESSPNSRIGRSRSISA